MRWCGKFRIKPTVSVKRICVPSESIHFLVVGSNVANNLSCAKMPASVKALSSVLFPALVYPAIAICGIPDRVLARRCVCRVRSNSSSCARKASMRRCKCLRSVSNLLSPGPRVPIPPPSLDKSVPCPPSRGMVYCSCASSTCNFPAALVACAAKISRISMLRSITRRPSSSCSIFRICDGVSSPSTTASVQSCV